MLGIPTHNGERFVDEALDSLLAQRDSRAVLVAVDDCSTDRTRELVAARGIPLRDHDERLGLVASWRDAFAFAVASAPDARYFAWGSDHDVWHPDWLAALVQALEDRPEAVLAYPLAEAIDEDGSPLRRQQPRFETRGIRDPLTRVRRTNAGMRAGDMVYGLFRVDALERCGPFPATLLPDRLLLARLALEGEFIQVDLPLWQRRYRKGVVASLPRQRRSLFTGSTPLAAYLPWWAPHGVAFWQSLDGPLRMRLQATSVYLTSGYLAVRRERAEAAQRRRRLRRRRQLARLALLRKSLPPPVVNALDPVARRVARRLR